MSTSTRIQYQSQGQLTTKVRYLHPVKIYLPLAESTVCQPILAFLFQVLSKISFFHLLATLRMYTRYFKVLTAVSVTLCCDKH